MYPTVALPWLSITVVIVNEQRQSISTRHAFAADEEAQPIRYRYRYAAQEKSLLLLGNRSC